MDSCQRELRRAAAQAFMQSLDDLEATFRTEPQPSQPEHPTTKQAQANADADLSSFERAVADIEEFMQHRVQTDG